MKRLVPYMQLMRLDKPIGIWLVFFPAAWAMLLSPSEFRWDLLAAMLLGAVLIRAAGCIINDFTDRKLDARVTRTKSRPLASGKISRGDAILLLIVLLADGLLLCLALPPATLKLALIALPFIILYPWMKRITWWPQLFLGLTFNFGALIGWAATGVPITGATILLYGACIFWTLAYDTLYAVQDMTGDARAGIKSSALRVGLKHRLSRFTGTCFLLMLILFTYAAAKSDLLGLPLWIALLAAASHAGWQVGTAGTLKRSDKRGGMLFRANQWLGLLLLAGLLVQRLIPYMF